MSHVTHIDESCHTYMSHVIHMSESCHTMSHVTHMTPHTISHTLRRVFPHTQCVCEDTPYGVATISKLHKILGLFWK